MLLTKKAVGRINAPGLVKPKNEMLSLPEKVLQFGTGVLLRGLPGYFIDKANHEGIFNGRVVVVKSTPGNTNDFDAQDSLYTLMVRGFEKKRPIEQNLICASISRVLSANEDWQKVLECAGNPGLQVIISNTTEAGIQLTEEKIDAGVPVSFPGKILSFLYRRYQVFGNDTSAGMVVVPTELITQNGDQLRSIILKLADFNGLDAGFIHWLQHSNRFCNSLVDRIVPGKPGKDLLSHFESKYGYEDRLAIVAEPYCLWAIEGDEKIREILSFCESDERVIIQPDISKYRELKLRLLNGTHTFSCGLALIRGFKTVRDAMADKEFENFITGLMINEIAPAIDGNISEAEKKQFISDVLDRFRNPFINHQWSSITLNYTAKMRMRNVPLLLSYYQKFKRVPVSMVLGFAAYLAFMRPVKKQDNNFYSILNGEEYLISDEYAPLIMQAWQNNTTAEAITTILKNENLWETDLSALPGFKEKVTEMFFELV